MPRKRKSSMLPFAPRLRKLALNLQLGRAEPEEVEAIVLLLRALAAGKSVDAGLGGITKKGAPPNDLRSQRVWDAAVMAKPLEHGGEGMGLREAWDAVAVSHGVTADTVEKDWGSPEGKKTRSLAENFYNPLKLPLE